MRYGLNRSDFGGPMGDCDYTVQSGDSLSSIAGDFYGDVTQYMTIADANGISDPNQISVGQVLTIPSPSDESDCDGGGSSVSSSVPVINFPPVAAPAPTPVASTSDYCNMLSVNYNAAQCSAASGSSTAAPVNTAVNTVCDPTSVNYSALMCVNTPTGTSVVGSTTGPTATSQPIPYSTSISTMLPLLPTISPPASTTASTATSSTTNILGSLLANLFGKPGSTAATASVPTVTLPTGTAAAAAQGSSTNTVIMLAAGMAALGVGILLIKKMRANADDAGA